LGVSTRDTKIVEVIRERRRMFCVSWIHIYMAVHFDLQKMQL